MRSIPRIGLLGLGMISSAAPVIVEHEDQAIAIQDEPEIPRMIERMARDWAYEIVTRKERRQWTKTAKKPKALRGRP